jgi:hypothetical protein
VSSPSPKEAQNLAGVQFQCADHVAGGLQWTLGEPYLSQIFPARPISI